MKKFALFFVGAALLYPSETFAQTKKNDTQYYVSGNIGVYGYSGTGNQETLTSDAAGAIHLRGGAKFAKIFGVEGEAGFGLGDIPLTNGGDLGMDSQFAGFGLVRVPIGKNNRDRADLFLKLGYHVSNFSLSRLNASEDRSEDGFAFGLGGNYYFMDKVGVRVEISSYNISDDFFTNVNDNSFLGGSLGVVTRF